MCCRVYLWVWWKRCRDYVHWITCDLMDTKNKTLPSREADLNHRPKDLWLNIRLQSSALPAELSRVGWWIIRGWLWYDMWSFQRSELKAKIAFDTLKRILWWKKFPSREADLNHRPKDLWLNIQLQSSALPAELSRVSWYRIYKAGTHLGYCSETVHKRVASPVGLEPTASGLEVRRAIHCATGTTKQLGS